MRRDRVVVFVADDEVQSGLQIRLRRERAHSVHRRHEAGEQEKRERWHVYLRAGRGTRWARVCVRVCVCVCACVCACVWHASVGSVVHAARGKWACQQGCAQRRAAARTGRKRVSKAHARTGEESVCVNIECEMMVLSW